MPATLTLKELGELADLFRLLGEPNRLAIVLACLDGQKGVGEIVEQLGLSQSLVSHHLRLLRTSRLLRPERRGKQVLYAIDDTHVHDVLRNMIAHIVEPHHHHDDHEHVEETFDPTGKRT